jgi:hypothetical protein
LVERQQTVTIKWQHREVFAKIHHLIGNSD